MSAATDEAEIPQVHHAPARDWRGFGGVGPKKRKAREAGSDLDREAMPAAASMLAVSPLGKRVVKRRRSRP